MLEELFDEEYLRRQYDKAEKKKNYDEGKAEGRAARNLEIARNLRKIGMTEEQIKQALI